MPSAVFIYGHHLSKPSCRFACMFFNDIELLSPGVHSPSFRVHFVSSFSLDFMRRKAMKSGLPSTSCTASARGCLWTPRLYRHPNKRVKILCSQLRKIVNFKFLKS